MDAFLTKEVNFMDQDVNDPTTPSRNETQPSPFRGSLGEAGMDGPLRPAGTQLCPTCGSAAGNDDIASPSYIYAIGKIEPRFPRPSVEKEYAQAVGRGDT